MSLRERCGLIRSSNRTVPFLVLPDDHNNAITRETRGGRDFETLCLGGDREVGVSPKGLSPRLAFFLVFPRFLAASLREVPQLFVDQFDDELLSQGVRIIDQRRDCWIGINGVFQFGQV